MCFQFQSGGSFERTMRTQSRIRKRAGKTGSMALQIRKPDKYKWSNRNRHCVQTVSVITTEHGDPEKVIRQFLSISCSAILLIGTRRYSCAANVKRNKSLTSFTTRGILWFIKGSVMSWQRPPPLVWQTSTAGHVQRLRRAWIICRKIILLVGISYFVL